MHPFPNCTWQNDRRLAERDLLIGWYRLISQRHVFQTEMESNRVSCNLANWAAIWQNQQNDCAPSEDSDQPGHPPSLIRVFAVHMKKHWVLSYPLSAQRRLWSDWADAHADLSLRWAHTHFVGFVMSWLNYVITLLVWKTKKWASSRENLSSGLRPGKTQTGMRNHRGYVEAWNFGYRN